MEAERLSSAEYGSIVAAAGCGKTETIARAVALAPGRQLVLTHTNAGVDAIRRRMRRNGVSSSCVAVDTIAGWCLKYVLSYPRLSGWAIDGAEPMDWAALYPAMYRLLGNSFIREVVASSYEGVFVDEYQDCTEDQHELSLKLRSILPTRILGDPLQAIFGFKGQCLPDWTSVVERDFPRLDSLSTPWRWQRPGHNRALGDWLIEARTSLEEEGQLAIVDPRVERHETPAFPSWSDVGRAVAFERADLGGTCAAIMKWPGKSGYHLFARLTGGRYQAVESIEAKDARKMLVQLQAGPSGARPRTLTQFMELVSSGFKPQLQILRSMAEDPALSNEGSDAMSSAYRLLLDVGAGAAPGVAAEALETLAQLPEVRVFRRELMWAVIDTLRDADASGYTDLEAALRRRRNLTSHVGRRLARCSVGSTLLLKGMEFDHAIVVDTGEFSVNELYVAITRGSKSLTIVSPRTTITPCD